MTSKEHTNGAADIIERVHMVHLFPDISSEEADALIENSTVRQFPAGSVICKEGDYGDTAYAIMEGMVEVSINTEGHENLTLSILDEGNIFGEMAAISGNQRNATVTATEDCTVLDITAHALKELIKSSSGFKETIDALYRERAVQNYLRKVPFFLKLEEKALSSLEETVKLISYNKGDTIFREGGAGDSLYIIRTGFVKVTKEEEGKEQIVAYLSHGNYFGEMALVEDETRSATVSAFSKTEVIQVLKKDFEMILQSSPELHAQVKDIITERKFNTLELKRDPEKARRLEAIMESGVIQSDSLLIIDLKKCIHCNNCVESCEDRHGYPRLDRRGTRIAEISVPVACRLCHDPLCLMCNFDAIKRAPSGEVHIIDEKCIGVSGCAVRCPYNVIKMVPTEPKRKPKWLDILGTLLGEKKQDKTDKTGVKKAGTREVKPKRLAIKCDTCMGYEDTACTNNCPTNAINWVDPVEYFGKGEGIIPKTEKYR